MGICSSCESTSVATAKLILSDDGQLLEYSYPVKASYVLQKYPSSFICNSDEMDFDDFVSAINSDEELQPGQLYFVLPLNKLKKRLQAEEIAALAVKASSALMKGRNTKCKNSKCKCRRKSVTPVMFPLNNGRSGDNDVVVLSEKKMMMRRNNKGKFGSSGRNFTSDLGAIAE